jgi:hypothetical protein
MSSVPEPTSGPAWNAEIIKCPGIDVFAVINMPLLSVPACVNEGDAGVTTVGSNVICRS